MRSLRCAGLHATTAGRGDGPFRAGDRGARTAPKAAPRLPGDLGDNFRGPLVICIVPLNDELALIAADLSLEHKLPMTDAIILATARLYGAEVVTSVADFEGVPGVTYIPKPKPKE